MSQYTYTYDNWGNIISITDLSGKSRTYTYNDFSEIESAAETYGNGTSATYAYTYDAGGNILTETINGTTHTYGYDSVWKDKLVSYDGQAITYDQEGHPLSYLGSTMTWDVHNRLSSITGATPNGSASNITYTYLSDGSRRSKTVDGVTTTYHYNNGLLLSQTTGDETIRFYYDSTGKVVSIGYQKGSNAEVGYFFARNAQGDIIGVYRSSDSKLIGTYEYDLWGKPVSTAEATTGIDTDGILSKNPLRYRGYYFDEESGFYYLQSRYYDPEVRRFVSADNLIASAGTSVEGYNLFGYCFNNPINMSDESGHWAKLIEGIESAVQFGEDLYNDISEDFDNYDKNNLSEEKVLQSNYFSCYKGVPVLRTNGNRSGSFGIIFITRETNDRKNPEDMVRHEYGHIEQLKELGVFKYATCIFIPSANEWGTGEYYDKPFEITADIYGGVQSRTHSQEDIEAGNAYFEASKKYGPFAWLLIE